MFDEIKKGVLFTVVTMALLGVGYHVVLWGIGRVAFPSQAWPSRNRRRPAPPCGDALAAGGAIAPPIAGGSARPRGFAPEAR